MAFKDKALAIKNMTAALIGSTPEKMEKDTDEGRCVLCGGDTKEFKNELSAKEFQISGLCQTCQNKMFT